MFESSPAVFSLSRSRKISEPSRASHKNFHFNFFHVFTEFNRIVSFRILQEVAAYLGATVLTEDEKNYCQRCFTGNATVKRIHISVKLLKFT